MTAPTLNDSEPAVALVVAAGSGSRLGGSTPKALRRIEGRSLLLHSLTNLAAGGVRSAVVTVPADRQGEFTDELAAAPIPVHAVVGGAERQDSVRLGLAALDPIAREIGARIVLVHDAARPLVPPEVVAAVIESVAEGHPAVVPALPVIDSVRRVTGDASQVVDRAGLVGVQTPQGFDLALLRAAHELVAARALVVTDDAAACEAAGHRVHVVPGSRRSMKITEPIDLQLAEALLTNPR